MKVKVAIALAALLLAGIVFIWSLTAAPPLAVHLKTRPGPKDVRPFVWWSEPTESNSGQYTIVRLDLEANDYQVNLLVNPPPTNAPKEANARLESSMTMAKVGNFLAAVNASPYTLPGETPAQTETWRSFVPGIAVTLRGFAQPRGHEKYGKGPAAPPYPIFWMDADGSAGFCISTPPQQAVLAFSAYHWLVQNREVGHSLEQYNDLNYRSAIGLSKDNRWLFLIVCGPPEAGQGKGVTYTELADFLLELDVANAMNLDGGSSTSMVIRKQDGYFLTPPPKRIVSRPIPVMIGVTAKSK